MMLGFCSMYLAGKGGTSSRLFGCMHMWMLGGGGLLMVSWRRRGYGWGSGTLTRLCMFICAVYAPCVWWEIKREKLWMSLFICCSFPFPSLPSLAFPCLGLAFPPRPATLIIVDVVPSDVRSVTMSVSLLVPPSHACGSCPG